MKKGILFLLVILLASCNQNEESINNDVDGTWQMTAYMAFMPVQPSLGDGDVVWTIEVDNNFVGVENTVSAEYPFLRSTGEYTMSMTATKITVNGTEYDYMLDGNELTLSDHPEVDGPIIKFIRL